MVNNNIIDGENEEQLPEINEPGNNGIPEKACYSLPEIEGFYQLLAEHAEGKGKSYNAEEVFATVRSGKNLNGF